MADPLIAVGDWPGVSLSCSLSADRVVTVVVGPRGGTPTGSAEELGLAYTALAARDVAVTLETTLATEALPVDVLPLLRYTAGAHLAETAAAGGTPVVATGTVSGLAAAYGVEADELVAANADRPLRDLVGETVPAVPCWTTVTAERSADEVVAALRPGAVADGAALLARNGDVPLKAGAVLAMPAVPVPAFDPGASLADVAAAARTTPVLLALDNATVPGLLRAGATVGDPPSATVVPDGGWSLAQAAAALETDVATLMAAISRMRQLLAPGVALVTAHFVAHASGVVLARNASGASLADLAAANGATRGLFDDGTRLYAGEYKDVPVPEGRTLRELAAEHDCPLAAMVTANAGTTLRDATVPGRVTLPAWLAVPYLVPPGDDLDAVAARFGTDAVTLATANAGMPGTLVPGRAVTLPDAETATADGDSFGSVHARLAGAAFADVVAAVGGLLAPGAVLACPPAPVAAATPDAAAAAYGVGAVPFVEANAAVVGLVAAGVTLTFGGATVTTGAADSPRSLVERFRALGANVSLGALMRANAGVPFLAVGARALLPPPAVTLSARVPESLPETAFPLRLGVTLRLARGTERADSAVPPDVSVETFEEAYPGARLAAAGADLWAVSLAPLAGLTLRPGLAWDGEALPRVFGMRPLHNAPVTFSDLPVERVTVNGTLEPGGTRTLMAIDAEGWARQLLAAVDRFLTLPAPPDVVRHVRGIAARLAGAVARGLWPVYDVPDPAAAASRAAAVAALTDELAGGLARGYDLGAVVQYDAALTPPAHPLAGVRLLATPEAPPGAPYAPARATVDAAAATSYVSVPLRTGDPSRWRTANVDLRYVVDGLSVGDPPVRLAFRPSDPVAGAPAGRVPVTLRGMPVAPRAFSALVLPDGDASLAQAVRWTYEVTCQHVFAPQDEVVVAVRFDAPPAPRADPPPAQAGGVAAALARYAAVHAVLWEILDEYAEGLGDAPWRVNAAASFATMVEEVTRAWDAHWPAEPPAATRDPGAAAGAYAVAMRVTYDTDRAEEAFVRGLELRSDTPGPGGRWPDVAYLGDDGPLALEPDTSGDGVRTYALPTGLKAGVTSGFVLSWKGLRAAEQQHGSATVTVRRNDHLLGAGGPPTPPAFVYAGAPQSTETVTPSITVDGEIDLPGTSLPDVLADLFAEVAGTAAARASLDVHYEYEIGPGVPASLPVLASMGPLDQASAAAVAGQLAEWLGKAAPASTGERALGCALTLWASADEGHALVRLGRLVHRLT